MTKFRFHEAFSPDNIKKFPKGWILRTELPKFTDQSSTSDSRSFLIDKIIFIDPAIWGEQVLNSQYWKGNTYHPSLSKMTAKYVKKNVIFIGKIVKKQTRKKNKTQLYDTILMVNSDDQYNEFDDGQCRSMLNIDIVGKTVVKNEVEQNTDLEKSTDQINVQEEENTMMKKIPDHDNVKSKYKRSKITNAGVQKESLSTEISHRKSEGVIKRNSGSCNTKKKAVSNIRKSKTNQSKNVIDTSDFILHKAVAFDFQDDKFSTRFCSELADAEVPEVALLESRYIVGYVCERLAKKKSAQFPNYKVAFEYAGEGMKEVEFTLQEIVVAMSLNDNIKGKVQKSSSNVNDVEIGFTENSTLQRIYEFNADDVEGEALESDDEIEEDPLKQTVYRLREGNYYFERRFNSDSKKNEFITNNLMNSLCKVNQGSLESNRGLIWRKNEEIDAPSGIRPDRRTRLNGDFNDKFRTEIESFLAFLPMSFWLHHLRETNKYMQMTFATHDKTKEENRNSNQYKDISLDELMIFYAIIIQMAVKPNPGEKYTQCWTKKNKVWWTACNNMSKTRFQEIRASLHWCDNGLRDHFVDRETRKKDTLYKIRPLLSIIEANLGKYLDPCTELSLDETCVAIRSQWARAMTFYNPSKPKGKHHLKFYTVCENSHWCALEIKMCHRFKKDETNAEELDENKALKNNLSNDCTSAGNLFDDIDVIGSDVEEEDDYDDTSDDFSIGSLEEQDSYDTFDATMEITDENIPHPNKDNSKQKELESQCETVAQKTVQTVTSLCKNYAGSGRVINMDNLYSSPLVFIKLKEMSLYARGTVRLNRKYLPKFIKYMRKDMAKLPRGSYQFAVNKEYNMSMHCWHDKNPVHVLSTADLTEVEEVNRNSGKERIIVKCPSTVKNYNKNMQAVDQYNKLMSLFSLAKQHSFTKYYKKIAMVLLDFVLVNSYLHHKLWINENFKTSEKKPCSIVRKKYMENLIDALIETDWAKAARRYEKILADKKFGKKRSSIDVIDNEGQDEHYFNEVDFKLFSPSLPSFPTENICQAVSFDSKANFFEVKNGDKMKSKFYCRVCQFEGRGNIRKGTVFCSNHGVSLCQKVQVHPKDKEKFTIRSTKIDTSEINDWDWLSPNQGEWSCWQKAHNHYIPQGLFKTSPRERINIGDFGGYSGFDFRSSPYLLRKVALEHTYYKKVGKKSRKDVSGHTGST